MAAGRPPLARADGVRARRAAADIDPASASTLAMTTKRCSPSSANPDGWTDGTPPPQVAAAARPACSSSSAIGPFQATSAPPTRQQRQRVLGQHRQRGAGPRGDESVAPRDARDRGRAAPLAPRRPRRWRARAPRRSRAARRPSCARSRPAPSADPDERGRAPGPARRRPNRGRGAFRPRQGVEQRQGREGVEEVEARDGCRLDDPRQVEVAVGVEQERHVALGGVGEARGQREGLICQQALELEARRARIGPGRIGLRQEKCSFERPFGLPGEWSASRPALASAPSHPRLPYSVARRSRTTSLAAADCGLQGDLSTICAALPDVWITRADILAMMTPRAVRTATIEVRWRIS